MYSDFKAREYTQLWGEFLPNMSIIDYIFNCGYDIKSFFENQEINYQEIIDYNEKW